MCCMETRRSLLFIIALINGIGLLLRVILEWGELSIIQSLGIDNIL